MNKLKLIWDFRGIDAEQIAKHHIVHLQQFLIKHQYDNVLANFQKINDLYSLAFIVIDAKDMVFFRDHLRPHRGERL